MAETEFCLLGPLLVRHGGKVVPVAPGKQRVLLAALLLSAGRPVPADELVEALWGSEPPRSARASLHNHVMRLRRSLAGAGESRVTTLPDGYLIRAGADELDVCRFESSVAAAREAARAGSWTEAGSLLRSALSLWRGEPLSGVRSGTLTLRAGPRLEEIRLQALEARIDADLHLGRHAEVIGELRYLAAVNPLRERLHALLMTALYRDGQQAGALAAYQAARAVLVADAGIEPGMELRQLQQQVLTADPVLAILGPVSGGEHGAAGERPVMGLVRVLPRQLPPDIGSFVGRAREMEALTGLVDDGGGQAAGMVVISAIGGTAGVGKTALAVHWAHQVAGRFPDGQLYVNLRGFGPSEPMAPGAALRGFLDALHVPAAEIPHGPEGQQGLYRSLLAGRKVLVVLDNARDADQVRPLLPGSPGCMVVITSRNDLLGLVAAEGAQPLCLDVFTSAEADELLARRIGPARLTAEPGVSVQLTGLCARLPLALAITAARATARPGSALAALAGELCGARARLDALATGEQATDLRAVFSWSYQSLPAPAARLFRLLGLHPGPDITAAAAASLAALAPGQAVQLLGELTRYHLLAGSAPGRYTLHDLLRAFAAEQAHAEEGGPDCDAAVGRMLDHYLHTCGDAAHLLQPQRGTLDLAPARPGVTPEPLAGHEQALAWLKAEHHVLVAATTLAAAKGHDTCAWQLPWSMATFLDWQGHWHDWAATQRIALAAVSRHGDKSAQATVRRAYAAVCSRRGDYGEARTQLQECLRLYAQAGDRAGESRVHRDLGNLFEYQDRYSEALGHAERALTMSEAIGDQPGTAFALTNVGWYHARLGHHQLAREYCQQALQLHRELGAPYAEAHTWDTLGGINQQLGNLADAAVCLEHARSLFHILGDRVHEATALTQLGDIHHVARNDRAAREAWRQALAILDELRHPDARQVRAKLNEADAS